MAMRPNSENYAQHVEHPRYGRQPRFTGLDPIPSAPKIRLHWNTGYLAETQLQLKETQFDRRLNVDADRPRMAQGTAIEADLSRQSPGMMPVTHYYDLD